MEKKKEINPDLSHWPMQGPQAFAKTVPPNSLKVSA